MNNLNVSNVRKMMRDLAFDPRNPGPLQPIIDVGNTEYYRKRAAEMILKSDCNKEDLKSAITLLSLALWNERETDENVHNGGDSRSMGAKSRVRTPARQE